MFNKVYNDDSSTLHPSGPNDMASLAPQMTTTLLPLLSGTTTQASATTTMQARSNIFS